MAIAKRAYANNAAGTSDTNLDVAVGSITTGDGIVVGFATWLRWGHARIYTSNQGWGF